MQQILYDQAPYHVLFYDAALSAYRTDRFGGWRLSPAEGRAAVLRLRDGGLRLPDSARPRPDRAAPRPPRRPRRRAGASRGDRRHRPRAVRRTARRPAAGPTRLLIIGVIGIVLIVVVGVVVGAGPGDRVRPTRRSERGAAPSGSALTRIAQDGVTLPGCAGSSQAILTIVGIVVLNFILFRAMPGSPERMSHNPNAVGGRSRGPSCAMGPRQAADPGPVRPRTSRRTLQGDFGQSFKYKGQDVTDVIAEPGLADAHPVRPRRAHRHRRRPRPRRVQRLETRRAGRLRRQRPLADPVFDAVFPPGDDPPGHLRDGPRMVPDVGHVHAR